MKCAFYTGMAADGKLVGNHNGSLRVQDKLQELLNLKSAQDAMWDGPHLQQLVGEDMKNHGETDMWEKHERLINEIKSLFGTNGNMAVLLRCLRSYRETYYAMSRLVETRWVTHANKRLISVTRNYNGIAKACTDLSSNLLHRVKSVEFCTKHLFLTDVSAIMSTVAERFQSHRQFQWSIVPAVESIIGEYNIL